VGGPDGEAEVPSDAARGRGPDSFGVGALNVGEVAQESEEDGFDEVPIFGATGEEGSELEDAALKAVDTKEPGTCNNCFGYVITYSRGTVGVYLRAST